MFREAQEEMRGQPAIEPASLTPPGPHQRIEPSSQRTAGWQREPLGQASARSPVGRRIDQMVREHFNGVWRLVRRYGLTPADADDVAQRTMMIAAQRIDEISLGSERPYLYRTALFITSKMHRDRRRHPQQSLEDYDEPTDSNPNPEKLLEQRRARARLDHILSQLPEDLRVVFLLYELESLNQGEIAATLGIPQGTVSSRLRRARERFAKLMAISQSAERPVNPGGTMP